MARTVSSVLDLVGNTPLIRLKRASEETGCEIFGKAEFLNPGQSIKDRAALWIIRDAEARGLLKPGGTIVEGTAGNTGIGLAMVANALGYKAVIVIPRTQAQEKKDAIRMLGAKLIEVDAVPYSNPDNYVRYSGRLAEDLAKSEPGGAIWANQFDNIANRQAHIDGTAPEVWAQTEGKIDGFICSVGSGGTLAGMGLGLRAFNPKIKIGLADPFGAALFSYYTTGELKSEGTSITEGIGQGRITANLEGFTPDYTCQVADEEWLPVLYDLDRHEGLLVGGSAALNVAGAIKMAKALGPGKTIVTVLCDYGNRYASKIFNPEFLKSKGLPIPPWSEG
ncbi:cysteine synthase A [Asticcacaulis sp. DW145]|uniref:Cysteine synthase A n=1 Tax=Asticcacaulis currens TaxID=2984210 RepID=A0ABT5IAH9_9CAUL|nr:cysteine synthase A [Asticcacaulis currens]BEV11686.1 cysteine synthase A [Asticcacaulis sp. DW145]